MLGSSDVEGCPTQYRNKEGGSERVEKIIEGRNGDDGEKETRTLHIKY